MSKAFTVHRIYVLLMLACAATFAWAKGIGLSPDYANLRQVKPRLGVLPGVNTYTNNRELTILH